MAVSLVRASSLTMLAQEGGVLEMGQLPDIELVPRFPMRNKEQYVHTLSGGCRFRIGLLMIVRYTVQIHPC